MTDCNGFVRRNAVRGAALLAAMVIWTAAYGQPFENPFDNPFDTPPLKSAPSTVPDAGPPRAQPDSGVPELRGRDALAQPPRREPSRTTEPSPGVDAAQPGTRAAPRQPAPDAMEGDPFRDDPVQPRDARAPADAPAERDMTDYSTPSEAPEPGAIPSGLDPEVASAFNDLLIAGRFAEAIPLLEAAAKQLPTEISDVSELDAFWYVWHRLGIAYRMTGKYDDAIRAFGVAAQIAGHPAAPRPSDELLSRLGRGIVWFYKGELRIAAAEFDLAASSAIRDPRPAFWKGIVLAAQGRYRDAITAYSSALRLSNHYPEARNNRGLAYLAIGEYDFAVADFDEVIREVPDSAAAYYKRAIALGRRGDLRDAVRSYDDAIRLAPGFAPAYFNRGLLHRRLRNTELSSADLAKARELYPQIETLARPTTVASR